MIKEEGPFRRASILKYMLLTAAVFFLPSFFPLLLGWSQGVLSIPVFLIFCFLGPKNGLKFLRNSLLLAGAGLIIAQRIEIFLFSLTFIPLGYTLYQGMIAEENAVVTGVKGIVTQGGSWIIFWIICSLITSENLYTQLVTMLDAGFAQAYVVYSKQPDISAEVLYALQIAIEEVRRVIPRILPGILGCMVIATVWFNLVISNILAKKMQLTEKGWGKYTAWSLPEQLVWLPISVVVAMLVGSGAIKDTAICLLLVSVLLYFFQGLAVFIHLLDKWNVPGFFRLALYFILIIQSYGLIFLAILGFADVWLNFRKLPGSVTDHTDK